MNSTKEISLNMIIEVLGRPPEHLVETLNDIIKKIGEEKGVKVKETKINEPKPMKDKENFFTAFAEVEVEVEEVFSIAILMFKYMPAHIEVISPENINLTNNDFNELFNELTRRLHGYDEVARVIQHENAIMKAKLKEFLEKSKSEGK